ncbi:hypothetical protein [Prevotella sp. E13-27]|uniref:hypothetical protein n=1 Tax=Prevotella sp. E13-27 TaxID=2938122 RepID=UPI002009FC77|nr:hypothetical protein [Prevotella sp. E13-27]MCK8621732.1 hypothetical protein [Prevotella sp. E13-27]
MKEIRISPTSILQKLENIENELREVREYLAQNMITFINADNRTKDLKLEYTLEDLYEAFGPSKQSYATRLRTSLEKRGVNTLGEFLALTPGQLLDLDGVGNGTLQYTHKALKKLGIQW